jgi:hypothetical protein
MNAETGPGHRPAGAPFLLTSPRISNTTFLVLAVLHGLEQAQVIAAFVHTEEQQCSRCEPPKTSRVEIENAIGDGDEE